MKILIVKPSSFGDIVQANPVLQALKSRWRDARIDWLVFKQWKQVVELFTNVTDIKVWDRKGGIKAFFSVLKDCNKENYDLVIDLQGLLRTALFVRLLNAKQKIGVSGMKEFSWLFLKEPYKKDPKLNAVLRNLKSVTYVTGEHFDAEFKIETDGAEKTDGFLSRFNIAKNDEIIAFIPFARGKTKNWNKENYLKLAAMIKEKSGAKIVVLGSRDDFGKIQSDGLTDLCGETDIKTLAGVLKRCRCAIGADTGAMHLANASGVNSLFIFGGSDIDETGPVGANSIALSANLPCAPCRGRCKFDAEKCLEKIRPEDVFKSVEKWIK